MALSSMKGALKAADAAGEKPWLRSYPPGCPATIDESGLVTLGEMFRQSVAAHADRPAAESFGKRMTYAELGRAADAVASWLQGRGLRKGDRVAIMLPNLMAYPAVLYGVLMAGGAVVNVNPLYTARELTHQLNDSGARILFVLENFGHTVAEALRGSSLDTVVIVTPGDLLGLKGRLVNLVSRHVKKAVRPYDLPLALRFRDVLASGLRAGPQPAGLTLDDVAFLQYTGGTTGVAKGAVLTHRNVAANVAQIEAKRDVMVSTLARVVQALGGGLELRVVLPGRRSVTLDMAQNAGTVKLKRSRRPKTVVPTGVRKADDAVSKRRA